MTDRLLQSIYGPTDLAAVAYAIANDGRRWLPCDRLSVLEYERHRCRLVAVSGVDLIDRRSPTCGTLQDLARYVATSDEPLLYPDDLSGAPVELERTIDRYVADSHTRQLLAVPLRMPPSADDPDRGQTVGVLVVEQFTRQQSTDQLRERLSEVESHFALALGHALRRDRAPLARLSRRLQRWQHASAPHRVLVTALLLLPALLLLVASMLPVEFRVSARGQLQPAIRQDIFAAEDGVVQRLLAQHGEAVAAGQLLVELSQPELDFAVTELDGALRTSQQELQSVMARRWDATAGGLSTEDENRLAAEQERLREAIAGLQQQRGVLEQRQQLLRLCSPVAGEVVTWDAQQKLIKRPVRRGQRLLSIVDPTGPWVAELEVADRDIRHVVAARDTLASEPRVRLVLATDPGTIYEGQVTEVADVTRGDEAATVRVRARVDTRDIPFKRPGATIVARIDCGQRSLLYNWFRHVWDWIRVHWWW